MSIFNPDDKPDYYTSGPEDDTPAEQTGTIDFAEEEPSAEAPQDEPRRHGRGRRILWWVVAILVVALGVTLWLRYFSPYVDDGRMRVYVVNVERRGLLFKTYEAEVISEASLTDTTRVYSSRVDMSVDNRSLVEALRRQQATGKPITISYQKYYGMLPWRGASTQVITGILNE